MPEIKQINHSDTYPIRQAVLRPNRPLATCFFEGDELATTLHFASYLNSNQTGILSLFKNNSSLFEEEHQYQIRGMAVLEDFQKYGFGKLLIEHAEAFLQEQHTQLIWCNAREAAINFYKKQGYKIRGSAFDIPDVGVHYVMYKHL